MTTHVVIGSDSARDYQFLAPLTALLWRDRIGHHPIVMKVGDWGLNGRGITAVQALVQHGLDFVEVRPMDGYESGRTGQQCRELVGCLPIPDEEWAFPTDADLWPIMQSFYYKHYQHPERVVSYYANGDHYQTLPTCHVAMQLRRWRALYGVKPGDDVTNETKRVFEEWFPTRRFWKDDPGFARWMADQEILTVKVGQDFVPVERAGHPPVDRVDRSCWRELRPDDVDAHVLRPADQPENWPRVFDLFSRLLPQHAEWAASYREEYLKGY